MKQFKTAGLGSKTVKQRVNQWLARKLSRSFLLMVLALLPGCGLLARSGLMAAVRQAGDARPLVVGYFPQWGIYNEKPYYVRDLEASGSARLLDQLNYAQGFVTNSRCSVADPNADLKLAFSAENSVNGRADRPQQPFRGNFHQLQELKRKHPQLKILISLEGKAASFAEDAQPQNRQAFVGSCVNLFLKGKLAKGIRAPRLFDGIDVDWEYPNAEDAVNFVALLKEFRRQMNAVRPGLQLTIAVGPSPRMYPGTDMNAINSLVDHVGIMNYDYAGPWNQTTGFIAPLFSERDGSIDGSVSEFVASGVARSRLLMGLPFYGYGWSGVPSANHGLFQAGKGISGDQPYTYVDSLAAKFTAYRDRRSQAPWLFDGQTFWTYEDPTSVRYKMNYARSNDLGGVMVWELSGDTKDALLLRAARTTLDHPAARWEIPAPEEENADDQSAGDDGADQQTAIISGGSEM